MRKSDLPRVGALSVRERRWQLRPCSDSERSMKSTSALCTPALSTPALIAATLLTMLCAPALAVPGGAIGTLEKGQYVCEIPGDGSGPARLHVPSADFTVITASSYWVNGARGSYLLTGDRVEITSGPFDGKRFRRMSRGRLHLLDDNGRETSLRCVLTAGGINRPLRADKPGSQAQ